MIQDQHEQAGMESEAIVSERDISSVMNDHVARLMTIAGVTGVGLGELEDKTPCILILVIEKTEELRQMIPETLEGHPVSLLETGEIKSM